MTEARWAIRFYVPFEEDNTLSIVGSYDNSGSRYLDDIVVFSGMYGVPDHMLWYIHKDLISYNFAGYSIELRLMLAGDPYGVYFQERYRVISVTDDFKSDRKLLYAIQEDHAKLGALLIDAEIATLEYDEKRNAEQALRDVLEANGIFGIVFCEHKDPDQKSIQFEYPKLTLDPSWTVGDFIRYIAQENNFEWAVKYGLLFIGPELYAYPKLNASRDFIDRTVDNISRTYHCVKIAWNGSPLNVLWYYEQTTQEKVTPMRCVWAKHFVGAAGDITKGCFYPIGRKLDKQTYFETLEGDIEKQNALTDLFRKVVYNQVKIVRVIKDEPDDEDKWKEYVDEITLEKDIDEYAKKTPRNIVMNTDTAIYKLPNVGRTTPYLDNTFGILFPSSTHLPEENGDPPMNPNRLLFSPNDRLEQAVLGPFVMGNGKEEFVIPTKGPKDFRLQLPIKGNEGGSEFGWCLYHNYEEEQTYLIPTDADPTEWIGDQGVDPPDDVFWIKIGHTPKIMINISEDTFIAITDDENINITVKGDITTNTEGDQNLLADGNIQIESINGRVDVTGDTEILLTVGGSTIKITSSLIELSAGGVTATLASGVMDVT